MAVTDRVDQFRALARQSIHDLFDQKRSFGRLALVQVFMLAGDTLVTISLAGSLFFSISPTAAKSKVLLYLLLTLAPFAVVSPLLGPLIDRSRGARRGMAIVSAIGRAAICPFMARDVHSLLLFPEAFLILILSRLYLVTRGALVPEMEIADKRNIRLDHPHSVEEVGDIHQDQKSSSRNTPGYAVLNARLTLLGTTAGFIAAVPGVVILKLLGSPSVLIFDMFVFLGAGVASTRLPIMRASSTGRRSRRFANPGQSAQSEHNRQTAESTRTTKSARPARSTRADKFEERIMLGKKTAHPEVMLGLTTISLIRCLAGFLVFLLAFGLRRIHADLAWYGFALGGSGLGAISGLMLMPRVRKFLSEAQILLFAVSMITVGALIAAWWAMLVGQVFLALVVGVAGALAQPSFDAMVQRYIPGPSQGRAFARFATRQQLVWVLGAICPVIIAFNMTEGDVVMAGIAGVTSVFYFTSRKALSHRAAPAMGKS